MYKDHHRDSHVCGLTKQRRFLNSYSQTIFEWPTPLLLYVGVSMIDIIPIGFIIFVFLDSTNIPLLLLTNKLGAHVIHTVLTGIKPKCSNTVWA